MTSWCFQIVTACRLTSSVELHEWRSWHAVTMWRDRDGHLCHDGIYTETLATIADLHRQKRAMTDSFQSCCCLEQTCLNFNDILSYAHIDHDFYTDNAALLLSLSLSLSAPHGPSSPGYGIIGLSVYELTNREPGTTNNNERFGRLPDCDNNPKHPCFIFKERRVRDT